MVFYFQIKARIPDSDAMQKALEFTEGITLQMSVTPIFLPMILIIVKC